MFNEFEQFPKDPFKIARNEICPCGSGKKFKRCCISKVYTTRYELLSEEALNSIKLIIGELKKLYKTLIENKIFALNVSDIPIMIYNDGIEAHEADRNGNLSLNRDRFFRNSIKGVIFPGTIVLDAQNYMKNQKKSLINFFDSELYADFWEEQEKSIRAGFTNGINNNQIEIAPNGRLFKII